MRPRAWIGSSLLLVTLLGGATALGAWKLAALDEAEAAATSQPEPTEFVGLALAVEREHQRGTTAIGTVLALRSVTLRNEIAGTVREVRLEPGAIVEAGELLVGFDVAVEEAELAALEAQEALAETLLGRVERALERRGASEADVDRARAERDVALARVARLRAEIERKTVRAPFRALVGLSDVHPGQFLDAGSYLTSLQGVDEAVHVDFHVAQDVAAGLAAGDRVEVFAHDGAPVEALVVALDARVDPGTRNALVRARVPDAGRAPAPGSSVRVRVPVGAASAAVAVPVSALRKGPGGDHVFVVAPDGADRPRAHARAVRSGPILGDEVLILEGLAAGEQVASTGSFKLREGALVAPAEDPR